MWGRTPWGFLRPAGCRAAVLVVSGRPDRADAWADAGGPWEVGDRPKSPTPASPPRDLSGAENLRAGRAAPVARPAGGVLRLRTGGALKDFVGGRRVFGGSSPPPHVLTSPKAEVPRDLGFGGPADARIPPAPVPQLLVSVRDAAEAAAALAGGADVVDVKEPARGALGAADPAVWAAVLRECAGRAAVSVALGEAGPVLDAVPPDAWCGAAPGGVLDGFGAPPRVPLPAGVRWAKLGPAGLVADWNRASDVWYARERFVPPPAAAGPFGWAAVAYADHAAADAPPPGVVMTCETRDGTGAGRVFLVDTFLKDGRGLFDHLGERGAAELCDRAKELGFAVALAGSLRLADVPRAVACGADVVAVRGAACDGGRVGRVSEDKVRALKEILGERGASAP